MSEEDSSTPNARSPNSSGRVNLSRQSTSSEILQIAVSRSRSSVKLIAGAMTPELTGEDTYAWLNILAVAVFIGIWEYIPQAMLASTIDYKFQFLDDIGEMHGLTVLTVSNMCWGAGIAGGTVLFTLLVRPSAAGSGLPQIIQYIDTGTLEDKTLFDPLNVVVKTVGIVASILSGLPVGREGPAIHIGAAMGYLTNNVVSRVVKLFSKEAADSNDTKEVRSEVVMMGCAAGFACAFKAPIGALMYVIEELTSTWDIKEHRQVGGHHLLCAAFASFVTTTFIRVTSDSGAITFSSIVIFGDGEDAQDGELWKYNDIPGFILCGLFTGFVGGMHVNLSEFFYRKRKENIKSTWAKVLDAALVASLCALLFGLIPFIGDICTKEAAYANYTDDDHRRLGGGGGSRDYVQYNCDDGYFNELASLALVGEEGAIRHLVSRDTVEFSIIPLIIFAIAYVPLASLCMGLALPAGSFVPALLLGALNGRIVGELAQLVFPNSTISTPGVYALVGAAGQLAAWTRTMITVVVTLIEITGDVGLIIPCSVVVTIARELSTAMAPESYTHYVHHMTFHHHDSDDDKDNHLPVAADDEAVSPEEIQMVATQRSSLQHVVV